MKWISVEEQLPAAYEEIVIVVTSLGNMGLALLENEGEVKWQFIPASIEKGFGYEIWEHPERVDWKCTRNAYFDNLEGDERVTHWMPLPAPPNASQNITKESEEE